MRFLVFSPPPPAPQDAVGAAAAWLRTSGLVSGLRALGHEVEVETASTGLAPTSRVHAVRPDVVVCGAGGHVLLDAPLPQPVVLDLGGTIGAGLVGPVAAASAALAALLRSIVQADDFLVSGPRQRLFALSLLLRSGVEQAETRVAVVPMPLPPNPPARPPFTVGSRAPSVVSLPELVSLPHEELVARLANADLAVDTGLWSLESETSLGVAAATALWSGVPLVYREHTDLGDLVRRYDAGWAVRPDSDAHPLPSSVASEITSDPAVIGRKADGARRLSREVFSWERAVLPLMQKVQGGRSPRREMDVSVSSPEDASLEVVQGQPVEQRFLSRVDGLCRVECCLSRRGRSQVAPVTLSLYRLEGGPRDQGAPRTLVAQRQATDETIRDNDWVELEFDPISDSAGATFALVIASVARQSGESVAPWACDTVFFPLLEVRHGDRPLPATSLCFRATSVRTAF